MDNLLFSFEHEQWKFVVYRYGVFFHVLSSAQPLSGKRVMRIDGKWKRPTTVARKFRGELKDLCQLSAGWLGDQVEPFTSAYYDLHSALGI